MNWLYVELALILAGAVIGGFTIIVLEERYYERHPEKPRPDVNPWP